MQLGMIGLGRMGSSMAERLIRGGHTVITYDIDPGAARQAVEKGALGAGSVEELVERLDRPRIVWIMVPAGEPTRRTVESLAGRLSEGDIIIDGGNSYYRDTVELSAWLSGKGLHLLDAGTSGGVWGLEAGYCLMIGGEKETFAKVEPVFRTLAPSPDSGYAHVGPNGAGHFVKMVHNGIEYGIMQSYAEGFELMQARTEFGLDLYQIAEVWRRGSVIRSWLLDLVAAILHESPRLDDIEAYVDDSGEGRWMVHEAVDLAIPTFAISQALQARFRSRQEQPLGPRLLSALRSQFGGHAIRRFGQSVLPAEPGGEPEDA
ncbi:MAG: decarboxylating 6-phosphogluconate dehydrogenase [Dehalococcoidia bacterium]|nr:decarboxylating 6-phosphogluconate dehydrogenase [Dehalococcoidia bacterium]